ncbi:CHAT domain-containing protein [Streptomyces sp. NPDC048383]|uniref:CHAT domain-containing protein n=1 Tax=Streptomyces sp. NPDC048383 TaxID=3155386 RepID=UPI003437EBDD
MSASVPNARAEHEEVMAELAALPAGDPRAPELCGRAGELSYLAHNQLDDPGVPHVEDHEDLDLAAEAFAHAFRRPATGPTWTLWRIMYGHVLALQYDLRPDADLAARAHALLAEGLAELPDTPQFRDTAVLARRLLANLTKIRIQEGDSDPALLDEALRRGSAALEDQDGRDADLQEALGYLWQQHGVRADRPDSYARSAGYYAQVLAAGDPDRDLPLVRQSRGMSLTLQGYHTADRAVLEEARDETLRALAEAPGRPAWERDARLRVTFARVVIAGTWQDEEQGASAEAELTALLVSEAEIDALPHLYLDVFGRLLFARGQPTLDVDLLDLSIALLTRAVDRRQAAGAGSITMAAWALAAGQHTRHEMDGDRRRLSEVERAALLALDDPDIAAELRDAARLMLADVQRQLGPEHPQSVSGEELERLFHELMRRFGDEMPAEFGDDHILLGDTEEARLRWERRFAREFEEWRTAEPGSRPHAERAAMLVSLLPVLDPHRDRVGPQREAELVDAVLRYAEAHSGWWGTAHLALAKLRLHQGMGGDPGRLTEALEHLEGARRAGVDSPWLDFSVMLVSVTLAQEHGITAGVSPGPEQWDRMVRELGLSPRLALIARAQEATGRGITAARRGDLIGADRAVEAAAEAVAGLAPDDVSRIECWVQLETVRLAREDLAHRLGAPPLPPLTGRPSLTELRRMASRLPRDARAGVLGNMALAWVRDALRGLDLPRVRECLALFEEAISLAEEGSADWIRFASEAGSLSYGLALAGGNLRSAAGGRDLERAVTLLEGAASAAGGPEHRLWAFTAHALAAVYRDRGSLARRDRDRDRERGRRLGLEAMRGFVWSALLQSGTQDVAEAARLAEQLSTDLVGWCLADRAPQDAVRALDACRGLILHTATTSRSVPELLAAAGHAALAAEWGAAGGDPDDVPSDLRRRVVQALTGEGTRLLDPPDPAEIGAALRVQGKDALVYLVPAGESCPGTALLVTATGQVHAVPLPRLREDAAPLRDYRPAAGGGPRNMEPAPGHTTFGPPPAPPLRDQLDRLCAWAWRAAVQPLLEVMDVPARPGRVPRLVLVPMGALGLVPWHAAYAEQGRGRRYAIERAEFSYAASARLLCEVGARPPAPHTGTALIVGNPTGDLPYAGEEADALQRLFYPHGQYLGLRTGDGEPGQVAAWLRERADEGAVLHLACHGTVEENRPRSSYLSLKGGELTAEELAGAVHGRLGLVVLAACRSQVSGRGHNEAYSLSTAFLVAGSRSVIGSLWPVPDDTTSVLMFLTHHFLRREQEPPARALRRAQLWMLDPARTAPAGLPPALAARLATLDPHDLTAWAGFTHLGQ